MLIPGYAYLWVNCLNLLEKMSNSFVMGPMSSFRLTLPWRLFLKHQVQNLHIEKGTWSVWQILRKLVLGPVYKVGTTCSSKLFLIQSRVHWWRKLFLIQSCIHWQRKLFLIQSRVHLWRKLFLIQDRIHWWRNFFLIQSHIHWWIKFALAQLKHPVVSYSLRFFKTWDGCNGNGCKSRTGRDAIQVLHICT